MNKQQANYKESDIPYESLRKLGISKSDIFSMKKSSLEAFLSGKRTDLFDIKGIDNKGGSFDFKGKLSLYKKEDGNTGLNIHPVNQNINNDINLNDNEIKKLQQGFIIEKTLNKDKTLIQLDLETNELLKAKIKDIKIPSHIKDIRLTPSQKELLKHGKTIDLKLDSGKDLTYLRIDLNTSSGLSFSKEQFDINQKIAFDKDNPQVMGYLKTDANRQEFTNYNKSLEVNSESKENKNNIKRKIN